MLDTLYSAMLATAFALTGLAICAELWQRFTASGATGRLGAPLAIAALGADAGSLAVHSCSRHRPGSEQALGVIGSRRNTPPCGWWLALRVQVS
jgi:hypothetical protein